MYFYIEVDFYEKRIFYICYNVYVHIFRYVPLFKCKKICLFYVNQTIFAII